MQKIIPHLWYDNEAKEAVRFYMSLFEGSRLLGEQTIGDTPSGDADFVTFELAGQEFMAISAGPYFKFTPAISLMVACSTAEEVDAKWQALSEGGTALMELGEYPFSKWYGWIQDRYGLSWQLMLTEEAAPQKITPNLLFTGDVCGKTEEAIRFYTEVFKPSEAGLVSRYAPGEASDSRAVVNYAAFKLLGYSLSAMDNGYAADFNFNEAFSLIVRCEDQAEIDYYWEKLSHVPESEQCGWLKDQFGVSWQIVPTRMDEMMSTGSPEAIQRLVEAFLKMKKFDIATLEQAFAGNA